MKLSKSVTESEGIKGIVKKVAVKVAMAVMIIFRDAYTRPRPAPPQQAMGSCRDKVMVDQYLKSHHSPVRCRTGMYN